MSYNSDQVMECRNKTKEKLVLYKGGKCEKCGYNDLNYLSVYDFHHKDPTQKNFTIAGKSYSFETLKKEVDKCILVCAICHRKIHEDEMKGKREERLKRLPKPKNKLDRKIKSCLNCGKPTNNYKYCNVECSSSFISKTPPRKILLNLKNKNKNNVEIAKIYGVTETSVRKWLRKYGISKELKPKILKPSKDEMEYFIVNDNMNIQSLSKKFKVNETTIRDWFKSYDLPKNNKEIKNYVENKRNNDGQLILGL